MKTMIKRIAVRLSRFGKRFSQRIRILYKAARSRVGRDRTSRTRFAYIALSLGTVTLAYLLVLLNMGVFRLLEKRLYGQESYEAVSIISAGDITDPLSRAVRVAIYAECDQEDAERAILPEERTRQEAIDLAKILWEQTLNEVSGGGRLKTGESVVSVLSASRYKAKLRDFFSEQTGAKIAVWGVQAYYTTSYGRVYCLSIEIDSRSLDVYSMTAALFENIDGSDPVSDFYPMLDALGEPRTVVQNAIAASTDQSGTKTMLTLSDGVKLIRETQPLSQVYLYLTP